MESTKWGVSWKILGCVMAAVLPEAGAGRADFKYSESSKVTGGAMAGMLKVVGAFSKQAREPIVSTTYLKGNQLRRDSSDGSAEIIDLDGKKIMRLNTQKRTYSVMTFDEMRAALEKMQAEMNAKMKEKNTSVQITPKFEINPTGRSQVLLGQNTHEVNIKVEMQIQAQDPAQQQGPQSGSFTLASDAWIAPEVTGYGEVHRFYVQMAKDLDWVPNISFGGDPRMAKALAELQKGGSVPAGLPLLQTMSFGMAGMPQGAAASSGAQPPPQPAHQDSSEQVSSAKDAAAKAIAGAFGGFGGFGRKKKKDQSTDQSAQNSSGSGSQQTAAASPAGSSGSLMDVTVQVTSFSDDTLDSSLFQVPAGYTQVQENPDDLVRGRRR